MSDTRKTINGLRHYLCPGVPDYLPSVTSILSATQSAKTQQKLAHWNIMNPGAADEAAERGSFIHNSVENHLRGLRVVPPEKYEPFWRGVPECVDNLLDGGRVLWSERPFNQPSWSKYVGDDGVGRIFYYDQSNKQGYAGCCDLIYMDNNAEIILADFKTSAGPYSTKFPNKKTEVDEKTKKALISGVFKARKTRLQLAAYKLAAETCLGIKINKTQIIVSTPLEQYQTQVFTFGETEVAKDEENWLALVDKYYTEVFPKHC
jgi:hypothetical protein